MEKPVQLADVRTHRLEIEIQVGELQRARHCHDTSHTGLERRAAIAVFLRIRPQLGQNPCRPGRLLVNALLHGWVHVCVRSDQVRRDEHPQQADHGLRSKPAPSADRDRTGREGNQHGNTPRCRRVQTGRHERFRAQASTAEHSVTCGHERFGSQPEHEAEDSVHDCCSAKYAHDSRPSIATNRGIGSPGSEDRDSQRGQQEEFLRITESAERGNRVKQQPVQQTVRACSEQHAKHRRADPEYGSSPPGHAEGDQSERAGHRPGIRAQNPWHFRGREESCREIVYAGCQNRRHDEMR